MSVGSEDEMTPGHYDVQESVWRCLASKHIASVFLVVHGKLQVPASSTSFALGVHYVPGSVIAINLC